jgi:hypothetical protein
VLGGRMTAEIAVANKWAVALAADSKVTVTGGKQSKTYDTVNKLFTLSKHSPVAIMIYGNAEFMEYPWETIIKMYRGQKGRNSHNTVSEWSKDFFTYLRVFGTLSPRDKLMNLYHVCESSFRQVIQHAEELCQSSDIAWGSPESIETLKEVLDTQSGGFDGTWLVGKQQTDFIAKFGDFVDKVTEKIFDDYKDAELSKLAEKFISAAIFAKSGSPNSTGVVIAGFGDQEIFPTILDFEVDGYLGSRLKLFLKKENDVRRQMTGVVRAFAQHDMVQRFMNGVDGDYATLVMTAFHETLEESCLDVLDLFGTAKNKSATIKAKIEGAVSATMKEFWQEIQQFSKDQFADPVLSMVAILPKDELANLAESLVSLTSLKRRVSSDAETVGGPIDVALISKGDGFVWIKRKHYFSTELNPQFVRRYLDQSGGLIDEDSSRGPKSSPKPTAERAAKSGGKRGDGKKAKVT